MRIVVHDETVSNVELPCLCIAMMKRAEHLIVPSMDSSKITKLIYSLSAISLCVFGLRTAYRTPADSLKFQSGPQSHAVELRTTAKKEWDATALPTWAPSFVSTGVYSWKPLGAAAEATPFRFKGKMYVMESVTGHTPGTPWPANEGGSYFRITELESGKVVKHVKESVGHAFFSAVVDHVTDTVWVFGGAHNRGVEGKQSGGECDEGDPSQGSSTGKPAKGCYVGGWRSTDLLNWSQTFKTVRLEDGRSFYNNDVTIVRPQYSNWQEVHGLVLPPHQAVMALESSKLHSPGNFAIAINTGTDGDLSRSEDWKVLPNVERLPEHACPAITYDSARGDYYLTGGGHMQTLFRSRDLMKWQSSDGPLTLAPVGLAAAGKLDLALSDAKIGPYFQSQWSALSDAQHGIALAYLKNMSKWGWGVSDYDWCCDDGESPTYMLYMISTQGHPKSWKHSSRGRYDEFQAIGTVNKPIVEWLRTHFSDETSNINDMNTARVKTLAAAAKLAGSAKSSPRGAKTYYDDMLWNVPTAV
eukprot:SAG31_NODE_1891_length_6975_cov_11.419430_6_plen_528_part_00